jgi:nucleoid-associated protein YgaU
VGGKFGLRPLLPSNSDGTINTGAIVPDWVLTEAAIKPDSYQVDYASAASSRPIPMAMLWRQQHDDTDVPIVRTLTVGDPNASGPIEQHDLSQFATSENHPAKVGAYLYCRRTLSTHTATVRLRPGNQSGLITEGDIVQLYLQVITSRESPSVINRWYQVESVGHALDGEETLSLSHFPVNSGGQSLIALAVANAVGTGTILTSNRTGGSCDLPGASSSTTVPARSTSGTPINNQGTSSTYWAATGAFIDPYSGAGAPSDSPPAPGATGASRRATGGGAKPPGDGTNSLGGDSRCPYGYSLVSGYIISGQYIFGSATCGNQGFRATSFPSFDYVRKFDGGTWTIEIWRVEWIDPDDGPQVREVQSIIPRVPSETFSCVFGIYATSYSCRTEAGTQGPTINKKLYRVTEGDTLEKISQKMYGTTTRVDDILAANPVYGFNSGVPEVTNYWLLWPGRLLEIPT